MHVGLWEIAGTADRLITTQKLCISQNWHVPSIAHSSFSHAPPRCNRFGQLNKKQREVKEQMIRKLKKNLEKKLLVCPRYYWSQYIWDMQLYKFESNSSLNQILNLKKKTESHWKYQFLLIIYSFIWDWWRGRFLIYKKIIFWSSLRSLSKKMIFEFLEMNKMFASFSK